VKFDLAQWSGRHLDIVGVAGAVVLTLLVYFGGLQPLRQDYVEQAERQQALTVQQDQALRLEAAQRAVQHRLNGVRAALAENVLPLKPVSSMNVHVASISALAVESGLQIDDVQTGTAAENAHCESVPICLAGGGSYRGCTAFLSRLHERFPDTSVSALELVANRADPAGAGKFRITLAWYAAPKGGRAAEVAGTAGTDAR